MVSWVVVAIAIVAICLVLLVARGMWLIGQGSDAEFDARARADEVPFAKTGFQLLDLLRNMELAGWLARLEGLLGLRRETRNRTVRCRDCRHTWVHAGDAGEPQCPNCGSAETVVAR